MGYIKGLKLTGATCNYQHAKGALSLLPKLAGFRGCCKTWHLPLCLEKWRPCDHRAPRQEVMAPDGRGRSMPSPQRTTPWPFASGATSSAFTARATTRTRRFLHLAVAEHHAWKKQSTLSGPSPTGLVVGTVVALEDFLP